MIHALPLIAETGLPVAKAQGLQPDVAAMAALLLAEGLVRPADLGPALAAHLEHRLRLADLLLTRALLTPAQLYPLMARSYGAALLTGDTLLPHPELTRELGIVFCLTHHLLPLDHLCSATRIVTAHPEDFATHRPRLEAAFGPVIMALAPAEVVERSLYAAGGDQLAEHAENSVVAADSCRSYRPAQLWPGLTVLAALLAALSLLGPAALFGTLTAIAALASIGFTLLKLAATFATLRPMPPEPPPPIIARLPTVSLMVALYHESNIAPRLVQRLGRLDYPRNLLDVILVVEADDNQTRDALATSDLPPWMRVVAVPGGSVKTKPRALNFALDHCRGSIVGVYDAEDAPEPDQIRKVVDRFHSRGPGVACLQGRLDFYNPQVNWFSRCFTLEYAAWFRLMLPGIARLGLAVPLGGTTLFFRRKVLEDLGRWDAHNVTEDADLGMRLARRGYRTELLDTTTFEEANCRPKSWVKQRSRWIKGYMMTWLTHMRDPALLWRELGPRQFLGFQLLLAGSVIQALLAPFLWSFWLVPMGLGHPVLPLIGPTAFGVLWKLFLGIEAVTISTGILANARTSHGLSPLWVPTLSLYHPMATLSAYKAAWEMLTHPFYWDKTSHGEFDQPG